MIQKQFNELVGNDDRLETLVLKYIRTISRMTEAKYFIASSVHRFKMWNEKRTEIHDDILKHMNAKRYDDFDFALQMFVDELISKMDGEVNNERKKSEGCI